MLAIPLLRKGSTTFDVVLVMDDSNVDRMKLSDPVEFDVRLLPQVYHVQQVRRVIIAFETPENTAKLLEMLKADRIREALAFVVRGWKYKPEQGDVDAPYLDMKKPSN